LGIRFKQQADTINGNGRDAAAVFIFYKTEQLQMTKSLVLLQYL